MAPPAPKIALGQSAAVFVGRVTSVEKGDAGNKYNFAISKQWKGTNGKTASIVTATNSAACGINFDEDRDYLIYAFVTEGDPQLRTNLCTRTTRAADAAADLAELGAPVKQVAANSYPVKNGIVQINADQNGPPLPLVALSQALQADKKSSLFRLNWSNIPRSDFHGTALYNRQNSTLKVYDTSHSLSIIPPHTFVTNVLYSQVSEKTINQLASDPRTARTLVGGGILVAINNESLSKYGITTRDLGSKRIDD